MAVITRIVNPAGKHLRPFDVRRDLKGVADLVELCFAETLDRDGQRYLQQMRDAARNMNLIHWASSVFERTSLPLSGYVWEEDGQLVGNLSLVPFFLRGRRCTLIANVATHPEYRQRGIARALTTRALEHARASRASAAWLHVRDDNEPAVRLYRSLGFQERARRTNWHSLPPGQDTFPPPLSFSTYRVAVRVGTGRDWPVEREWMRKTYPPAIAWHLPFQINALRPDLWGEVVRFFSGNQVQRWVADQSGTLLATLAWQNMHAYTDALWLAAPETTDGPVITSLLRSARQDLSPRRPLALDFPAGRYVYDIQQAGFQIHNTLIWMEVPFS